MAECPDKPSRSTRQRQAEYAVPTGRCGQRRLTAVPLTLTISMPPWAPTVS
jgi:hypothetical protein